MQKRLFLLMVILTGTLLFCLSCEKKGVKEITPSELIQQGWLKFEAGNFAGAGSDFSAALSIATIKIDSSGAFLGLGWAQLRQNQGGLAENSLVKYLSLAPGDSDGRAGLAFAYSTPPQNKFREAIDTANVVLSSNPSWTFSHDASINSADLHLILAQCYYNIANFDSSLIQVRNYYDPNFWQDVRTPAGKDTLGMKIQKWGSEIM
jgi:outer membrane protein assembly factor BamD (BamD/ComL family)